MYYIDSFEIVKIRVLIMKMLWRQNV